MRNIGSTLTPFLFALVLVACGGSQGPLAVSSPAPSPSASGLLGTPKLTLYPSFDGFVTRGLLPASDGNIWYTCADFLAKMSPSGVNITQARTFSAQAFGLVPGGNNVYFAAQGSQVGVTGADLSTLRQFVTLTRATSGAIAFGPDGRVWVAEVGFLAAITPSGMIVEYAIPGTATISAPAAIVAGLDGAMWYTNPVTNRIGKMTTLGVASEFGSLTATPTGLAIGPDQNMWFTESSARIVGRITPSGSITEFTTQISAPNAIVAGPDGNLWVTGATTVSRVTTSGSVTIFNAGAVDNGAIVVGPDRASLWFAAGSAGAIGVLR